MSDQDGVQRTAQAVELLRRRGAVSAYLHRSRATRAARSAADIDGAASFQGQPPRAFDVLLPAGVGPLVLNSAALDLAGRVALQGQFLVEPDRHARVAWEATTGKTDFGELPRMKRAHRDFAEAILRRGGPAGPVRPAGSPEHRPETGSRP